MMKDIRKYESSIGDLVWIPANTPLMYFLAKHEQEFNWRATEKKEPVYGLVISNKDNILRVLVSDEEFYVQKHLVYGA